MLLAGYTTSAIMEKMRDALDRAELPPLEAGAMSYMMAKGSYLTDVGGHNGPHLMFFAPIGDPAVWGAGLSGSPVGFAPYWLRNVRANQEVNGLAPVTVFTVSVPRWSDGTLALSHMH